MIEQGQYALGDPFVVSQHNIDEVLGGSLQELEAEATEKQLERAKEV